MNIILKWIYLNIINIVIRWIVVTWWRFNADVCGGCQESVHGYGFSHHEYVGEYDFPQMLPNVHGHDVDHRACVCGYEQLFDEYVYVHAFL